MQTEAGGQAEKAAEAATNFKVSGKPAFANVAVHPDCFGKQRFLTATRCEEEKASGGEEQQAFEAQEAGSAGSEAAIAAKAADSEAAQTQ